MKEKWESIPIDLLYRLKYARDAIKRHNANGQSIFANLLSKIFIFYYIFLLHCIWLKFDFKLIFHIISTFKLIILKLSGIYFFLTFLQGWYLRTQFSRFRLVDFSRLNNRNSLKTYKSPSYGLIRPYIIF